jgi:hypothetical protein
MKTAFALILLLVTATIALPQGKIRLINDSLHLVYWSTDVSQLNASDAALAGEAYVYEQGGQFLTLELWAGSSASLLSSVSTTDFIGQAGAAGEFSGSHVTLPFPGGTPTFFQIYIYDSAADSYAAASSTLGHYFGQTPVFTTVPSDSTAYNGINNHNPPANSTWADGTYNMDFFSPGFRGAIMLQSHRVPLWISTQPSNQVVTLGRRRDYRDTTGRAALR